MPPTNTVSAVLHYSGGLWRVHPDTTVTRTNPLTVYFVPFASQFHYKAEVHEQAHRSQWQPGGMNADLYNPAELRALLLGLTHSTQEGLIALIQQTADTYAEGQAATHALRESAEEAEAYAASDQVAPQYIYQGECGL
jgi:hypothetical protein